MLSRPLLTLHEVAELLKVKEATVRTWINNRMLRAVKFGREWRVSHKDLEAFVASHATVPSQDDTVHTPANDEGREGTNGRGPDHNSSGPGRKAN
jgi:excisionase family DNA binding protein